MSRFDLSAGERSDLWDYVVSRLDNFYECSDKRRVAPLLDKRLIRDHLEDVGLSGHKSVEDLLRVTMATMEKHMVHITHPMYYGLFNPRPTFPSILGDVIAAVMNPQMAAWSHAPFAAECEKYLIRELGQKIAWNQEQVDGTFCTGGAESNLTAVLCALCKRIPGIISTGMFGLEKRPMIYTSNHSHDSVDRAARVTGLGSMSVRLIDTDDNLRMDVNHLDACIKKDIADGLLPLMVVGTVGTTGPGSVDPLTGISKVAKQFNLWFHVDGAYGAALALHDEFKNELAGIENADSITCDIHKWLSVPMGASVFLTAHPTILHETFRIQATYMPKESVNNAGDDPFSHSIQWSRRFIGLKCYLSFTVFGWDGLRDMIKHTCEIGDYLKDRLQDANWKITNETVMPIACFYDPSLTNDQHQSLCNNVVTGGQAWISTYPVGDKLTLRACITNYQTERNHIDKLIQLLSETRQEMLMSL